MLQIIGTKKCPVTKKALRYCKERSIAHQFIDLNDRELSEGEWRKVFASLDAESLVDDTSAYYRKEGYAWREFDSEEELRCHPQLLKTPLLKHQDKVVAGLDTEFLERFGERP